MVCSFPKKTKDGSSPSTLSHYTQLIINLIEIDVVPALVLNQRYGCNLSQPIVNINVLVQWSVLSPWIRPKKYNDDSVLRLHIHFG